MSSRRAWGLTYSIIHTNIKNSSGLFHEEFVARDVQDACNKLLPMLKRIVRKRRTMKDRRIFVMAAPYIKEIGISGDQSLDGDQMIRLKDKVATGRRILRAKDVNLTFAIGYGETRRDLSVA